MPKKKVSKNEMQPIKKGKYDITVKTDLSFDELLKLAANTSIKNSRVKKK